MFQTTQTTGYSSYILGFNIKAEGVSIVYGNHSGIISEKTRFAVSPDQSFQSFLGQVSQHSDKLLNVIQAQHLPLPDQVSISVAGSYNAQQGILFGSRDFPGWKNEALRSQFQLLFNLPVYIERSAEAGAIAEMLFGSTRDYKDFVFLDLGANISLANVFNAALQRPTSPHAGFIGRAKLLHMKTETDDNIPTLNEISSPAGIVNQALKTQASHWNPEVTIYQIINAIQNDDPYAIELLEKAGSVLGQALAPFIHQIRPECMVIGFPLCLAGELFSDTVFKSAQVVCGLGLEEMPRVIPSALGNRLPELQALAPAILATKKG